MSTDSPTDSLQSGELSALEATGEEAGVRMVSPSFVEALSYAAQAHVTHVRKGSKDRSPAANGLGAGVPYVAHLLEASALVLDAGGSDSAAIAALLHDVVEDWGGVPRLEEVRRVFGTEIAAIVESCSDSLDEQKKATDYWFDRKRAHVRHVANASPDALLVLAADKTSNGRATLADLAGRDSVAEQLAMFESFRPYADASGTGRRTTTSPRPADPFYDLAPEHSGPSDEARRYSATCALWYYQSIVSALRSRFEELDFAPLGRLLNELSRVVGEIACSVAALGVATERVADQVALDAAAGWPDID